MYIVICSIYLLLIHNTIAKNEEPGPVVDTNFGKVRIINEFHYILIILFIMNFYLDSRILH